MTFLILHLVSERNSFVEWTEIQFLPFPHSDALLAEEYNEFMVSDDQQESLLNYRTKREAPCGAGHKKELPSQRCCKEAIERPEAFDKVRDLKKECFGQVKGNRTELDFEHEMFSCERIQKKKEDMRCAYECIAKKQKMVSLLGMFEMGIYFI